MSDDKIIYSLSKVTDHGVHDYIDQGGCSWNSPNDWLFIDILGGCGCGNSQDFGQKAVDLLRHFGSKDWDARAKYDFTDFAELMAHWFDSVDLIEHGTIISGSWLTEKGQAILDIMNTFEWPETINGPDQKTS